MKQIPILKQAIETTHECKCEWFGAVPVKEAFKGETAWDGLVHIFGLKGHPKAKTCYAWFYVDDNGEKQCTTALDISPVDSPETAVKIAIAAQAKK